MDSPHCISLALGLLFSRDGLSTTSGGSPSPNISMLMTPSPMRSLRGSIRSLKSP